MTTFLDDPEKVKEFERELELMKKEKRALQEELKRAAMITEEDLRIVINCRE